MIYIIYTLYIYKTFEFIVLNSVLVLKNYADIVSDSKILAALGER